MALKLALDGFDVVCCTASDQRFRELQAELLELLQTWRADPAPSCSSRSAAARAEGGRRGDGSIHPAGRANGTAASPEALRGRGEGMMHAEGHAASSGRLLRATRVDEGVEYRLWVVGKYDTSVR